MPECTCVPGFLKDARLITVVRCGKWKAVRFTRTSPLELYDLKRDVGEKHNIADANPASSAKIEAYLRAARTNSAEYPID